LQAVVETLEQGDAPLEQALSAFERGVSLARLGSRRLDEAERRVELLLSDEDGVRTRPIDKELIDDD
jgi:exodeoxyribonuclease VII small subunit